MTSRTATPRTPVARALHQPLVQARRIAEPQRIYRGARFVQRVGQRSQQAGPSLGRGRHRGEIWALPVQASLRSAASTPGGPRRRSGIRVSAYPISSSVGSFLAPGRTQTSEARTDPSSYADEGRGEMLLKTRGVNRPGLPEATIPGIASWTSVPSTLQKFESERFGWYSTICASTAPGGRRSPRSLRRSDAPPEGLRN